MSYYRVGVDIDGVLYKFVKRFREYIAAKTGRPIEDFPEVQVWSFFSEQWNMTLDEYLQHMEEGLLDEEIFWYGDVIEGALDGVKALVQIPEVEVVYLTNRGNANTLTEARDATAFWLFSNGFPTLELILDSDKTKHNIDLLIDDGPDNYIKRKEKGLNTLVFDQPWNRYLEDAPRAHDWTEVVTYVRKNFSEVPANASAR